MQCFLQVAFVSALTQNTFLQLNQDAKLEKLQKKHEAEKQAAIQEFNNFKAKMTERDQKIAQGFQKKYDGVRAELEGMNKKFLERIEQFENTNRDLKRALEDSSKNSSEMQELKKKYDNEIAELVRSSNEKYQAMMVDQLQTQSNIRKEMEQKLEQLRAELAAQYAKDLQTELGKERAMLGGDKQEALMAMRRELEDQLALQKNTLNAQIEKLNTDVHRKSEECVSITNKSNATIADLNSQIDSLRRSMDDQAGGTEARVTALNRDIGALKEQLQAANAKVTQREEELTAMRGMLSEKNTLLIQHEDKYKIAQEEIYHLKAEIESARQAGASSADDLRVKLTASQREAESFRAEINQIAASLATVRDDLKKSKEAATKAAAEHAKALEALNNEKEVLQNKIQELRNSASSANADMQNEMDTLKKSMEEKVSQLQQQKNAAIQEGERLVATLTKNHKTQREAQDAEHQQATAAFAQKEALWNDERSGLLSKHSAEVSALQAEYARVSEEAAAKREQEASSLKASLSALEGQLQSLSEQADGERAGLKTEVAKWESKAKGLQKELDAKKKDSERQESVTSGLKNQVESLREELKASQKAFREKMDMSTAKLEQEWQDKLDAQVAASDKAMADLKAELLKAHSAELTELALRHDEDVKSLKSMLQKEHTAAAQELADNEKLRLELEAQLKAEKAARAAQVAELTSSHAAAQRTMEETHRQEVERLRRELKSSAESQVATLTAAHAAEVERLNRLVEGTTVEYTQRMAVALEAARVSAEEAQRHALSELDSRSKRQQAEALDALSREHAEATRVLTAQFESEKSMLQKNMAEMRQQFVDASGQIASMENVIGVERRERQRREENFVLERDQLERAHESNIRREKEVAERKILEVMERASADMSILRNEHIEVRNQYEDRLNDMTAEFRALEKRYHNRESREEDIARIQQLMNEMVEKDELVLRTKEEMMYFKREMLNREENYNQKFGKSPNIGVMQVIKTKDAESVASNGKAKPTQMRMINPNGGNNMMSMGPGVGGMGVGGIGGVGGGSVKSTKPGK